MMVRNILSGALFLGLAAAASAAGVSFEGVPIKIGDTVEQVQKALGTDMAPEVVDNAVSSPLSRKKTQIRLKSKGIWVFFDKGAVYTIRLDPPFSGNIGGVKLHEPAEKITRTFGPPVKTDTFGINETYTYYFDDITTTRFVIDRDGELETIFLVK